MNKEREWSVMQAKIVRWIPFGIVLALTLFTPKLTEIAQFILVSLLFVTGYWGLGANIFSRD